MKYADHTFLKPKMTSSNGLFCPTNSLKPKDIRFAIIHDKEKLQILKLDKLEADNAWYFFY